MKKINICIAGLGNVGTALIQSIEENNILFKKKHSLEINILGISANQKNKKRNFDIEKYRWFDNPLDMA